MSGSSKVAADRSTISWLRLLLLTALTSAQIWATLTSLPLTTSIGDTNVVPGAATLCALLAMFGLRSIPIRHIARSAALLSGLALARFGQLGAMEGVSGSWRVLLWIAATAGALALAPSSRGVPIETPSVVVASAASRPVLARRHRLVGVPLALVVAAVSLVGAAALLGGPWAANGFPVGSSASEVLDRTDLRKDNALIATDELDMRTRPRLSDQVVMTVRSPHVSFWRSEVFDDWDGAVWRRTEKSSSPVGPSGEVVPSAEDIAATEGELSRQEFRLEIGFATAVPLAPSVVSVDSKSPMVQRPDGSLVAGLLPMGEGTTYSIESRRMSLTAGQLREADSRLVPEAVRARFASAPVATDRVVDLARSIVKGSTNDFDRVRAIEEWMDSNTTYSLDAPLAPQDADVVDHFLFESRQGWCEQIASSLVVMARLAGVPARLATGFAPGEVDRVGGRFIVREKDAHAWAEVWFEGAGWVPFDPTADVPLSGAIEDLEGSGTSDWREVAGRLLLAAGIAALAAPSVFRLVRRALARWSSRRARRAVLRSHWDAAAEHRLEQLGERAGRPRTPSETITVYSIVLADTVGDERLAEVGEMVDSVRYGPDVSDTQARDFVEKVLADQ